MKWNQAMTADGPVSGTVLGSTYVHEHLMVKPQSDDPKYIPYTLQDEQASGKEATAFAKAGGNTLVEMTPIYYGRNAAACRRIAHKAGIQVICCTGFHKQEFMPPWFEERTDGQLYDMLMDEVQNGLDGTGIRPGVIKLGTSLNTITPQEKRSIQAVARVHLDTGIPISTHCDKGTMGMEQIRLLEKMGVDPARVLLCHIDIPMNTEYALSLCRTGATICFDHVGRVPEEGDPMRVKIIMDILDAGYGKNLTLSGDMGKKGYLPAYGGKPGLTYILGSLKEQLMHFISEEEWEQMMVRNPCRIFAGNSM